MNNKRIILSFLLVVLIALSVSSVSAEDTTDIIADDGSQDVLSDSIQPDNDTVEAVQNAINSAKSGDVIDLSNYGTYDFGSTGVTIQQSDIVVDGKGTTTVKGYGNGNGLFFVRATNVTISGITFIGTNPNNNFTYGGSVNGSGVNYNGANNGVIKDCNFANFSSGVVVQSSEGVTIENNNFTGGYSTYILNDPTVNTEKGTKALNIYRQSSKITVTGKQGSGSNIVENNIFINNTYSIYFGGASTKNSVIRNNTFINCGQFKLDGQNWEKLPVVSIQKASNDIAIVDNTFKATNNSVLIAAEQGNEAHGFPSSLGNINVTGSNVTKYSDDVNASSVVLFHVLVRNDNRLHLFKPIIVKDNTLEVLLL